MQSPLGKPRVPSSPLFVFDTQPLAKPSAGVLFHRSVGLADRTQTEVVGPTVDLTIKRTYCTRPVKSSFVVESLE
jgi:hypothetical protein